MTKKMCFLVLQFIIFATILTTNKSYSYYRYSIDSSFTITFAQQFVSIDLDNVKISKITFFGNTFYTISNLFVKNKIGEKTSSCDILYQIKLNSINYKFTFNPSSTYKLNFDKKGETKNNHTLYIQKVTNSSKKDPVYFSINVTYPYKQEISFNIQNLN